MKHHHSLLLGTVAMLTSFVASSSALADTIAFDTTTSAGWTATGGGAQDVTPYVVLAQQSVNGGPLTYYSFLTVTSTGGGDGTFLPGGSLANFTGFWKATYTFSLPQDATNPTLNYDDFFVDDRAVISLNGQILNATGIYAGQGGGSMVLTDGGGVQSYSSFAPPNGDVSGTTTTGFIIGGTNTIEAIINDTGNGIYGSNRSSLPYPGNTTYFGLSGTISYTVPEPASAALLLFGSFMFCGRRRAFTT